MHYVSENNETQFNCYHLNRYSNYYTLYSFYAASITVFFSLRIILILGFVCFVGRELSFSLFGWSLPLLWG